MTDSIPFSRETVREWSEVQAHLQPLSTGEQRALAHSIDTQGGVIVPVLVLPDGRIIDGHHRWRLSKGEAPLQVLDVPDSEAYWLAFALNAARRQMSPEQSKALGEQLRQDDTSRRERALVMRQQGMTQQQVADTLGVAQKTVDLWEEGDGESISTSTNAFTVPETPDLRISVPKREHEPIRLRHQEGERLQDIAADYKVTPQRIGQIIRLATARGRVNGAVGHVPSPEEKYRCLVIDPPWPMEKLEREVRPDQGRELDYPTLPVFDGPLDEEGRRQDIEHVASVPALADAAGCHVYLWATHRFVPDAFKLFTAWGVKYQCLFTWVKPTGPTPFSWMYNTELVLFGRIGTLPLERLGLKLSFEGAVAKGTHSKKPDVFYERVVAASPGPRLEMFARTERDGFEVWGNEIAAAVQGASA